MNSGTIAAIAAYANEDYAECAELLHPLVRGEPFTPLLAQLFLTCLVRLDVEGVDAYADAFLEAAGNDPWMKGLLRLTAGKAKIADLVPIASTAERQGELHYWWGARLRSEGLPAEARQAFLKAVELAPETIFGDLATRELESIGKSPGNPACSETRSMGRLYLRARLRCHALAAERAAAHDEFAASEAIAIELGNGVAQAKAIDGQALMNLYAGRLVDAEVGFKKAMALYQAAGREADATRLQNWILVAGPLLAESELDVPIGGSAAWRVFRVAVLAGDIGSALRALDLLETEAGAAQREMAAAAAQVHRGMLAGLERRSGWESLVASAVERVSGLGEDQAIAFMRSVGGALLIRFAFTEGAQVLFAAHERDARSRGRSRALAYALMERGGLLASQEHYEEALSMFKEQEQIASDLKDLVVLTYAFSGKASVLERMGKRRQGILALQELIVMLRRLRDEGRLVTTLGQLSTALERDNRFDEALVYQQEQQAHLARKAPGLALLESLCQRARLLLRLGESEMCLAALRGVSALAHELDAPERRIWAECVRALVCCEQPGSIDQARAAYAEARKIWSHAPAEVREATRKLMESVERELPGLR